VASFTADRLALTINDCYIGSTNTLERCSRIGGVGDWQSVFTFVSITTSTNWEDIVSTSPGAAFYRVRSHALP
jgi:hypothetical protein